MTKCSVQVCDREEHTRGWCQAHYFRWRRNGDPGNEPVWDRKPRNRKCGIADCEEPHHARGYCSTHLQRIKKHGDPDRVDPKVSAEKNPSWLGDEVGYSGAHQRVKALHGPASGHRCCICGRRAQHWAYDHADPDDRVAVIAGRPYPYSPNPERYSPMCVQCHKYFDLGHRAAKP